MKRITLFFCMFVTLFFLAACQNTVETPEENTTSPNGDTQEPDCEEVEVPTCEETPQLSFFETLDREASGFTPAYRYFLAGSLNDDGIVTSIHFDMVTTMGVSKRSTDYRMNVSYIMTGGMPDHQTLEIYVGMSTHNIPQGMFFIRGAIAHDGSDLIKDLPIFTLMGAPINRETVPVADIYQALSTGLTNLEIDDTTTVAEVLAAVNLFDAQNEQVRNGRAVTGLTGRWGGGTFHQQMLALEQHIVGNNMTLEDVYALLTTSNQADDVTRDTVAGATVMFYEPLQLIVAQAAGIDTWDGEPTVVEYEVVGGNHEVTVRVKGYYEMLIKVIFNSDKTLTDIVVLEERETPSIGGVVFEGPFIETVISNQDDLEDVDLIAGATDTSKALVDAVTAAQAHIE